LVLAGCGVSRVPARSTGFVGVNGRGAQSVARGGCAAESARRGASSLPFADASRAAGGGWSAPVALVRAGTATESLGVSATPSGSLLAGWVQGPPPKVSAGGPELPRATQPNASRQQPTASAQEVRIAQGSFASGFHRPVELSAGPSGSLINLHIALSAPNVGYAVWDQQPATTLHLSVIFTGQVVVSDRPLLRDAVPLAVFPLIGGRAALVFDQYGHGTPFLDYAVLSATGRMGRIARIAHPGTRDTAAVRLAVNPRGELIASWVHDDLASPPGSSPTSRRFVAAKLVVAVCKPALRCASPQTVPLGETKPACINPAVAISPDGTTTLIAAANDWGAAGCGKPLGIRASITQARATHLQPMRLIQTTGDFPLAETVGNAGTVMVFNPGVASSNSFAWSFLPASSTPRSPASLLDSGGWWNAVQQPLAPANNGWYLIAWTHANRNSNPQLSIRAALGHNDRLQPASVAVSARRHTAAYAAAASGRGDAIILFSGSTDTGAGSPWPYSSGLYATVLRR
jgi:hypothetical protein